MTSGGGALLLRETDRRLNLLPRLAECFLDRRNPVLVTHPVTEMVAQRVYALALGYEDLNDHEQLRQDPLLHVRAGQAKMDEPLVGKSTLNRLELGDGSPHRYKKITYWKDSLDALVVALFLDALLGGMQQSYHVGPGERGLRAGRASGAQKRRTPDRAGCSTHPAGDHQADFLEKGSGVSYQSWSRTFRLAIW
jgi:hypothetical protein